jgi:hypothetical protein
MWSCRDELDGEGQFAFWFRSVLIDTAGNIECSLSSLSDSPEVDLTLDSELRETSQNRPAHNDFPVGPRTTAFFAIQTKPYSYDRYVTIISGC